MHHTRIKDTNEESGKPKFISFYNLTKGGVDAMDEICAKYTCSRRTQRWTMVSFYK